MASSRRELAGVALVALSACGPPWIPLNRLPPLDPAGPHLQSETLELRDPDAPGLTSTMARLARVVLGRLPEPADDAATAGRALLELAACTPAAALASALRARALATPADPSRQPVMYLGIELAARARVAADGGAPFERAFARELRAAQATLGDLAALHAASFLPDAAQRDAARADLAAELERLHGKPLWSLPDGEAAGLARRYALYAYTRDVAPLVPPLQAEDDARRYEIAPDVRIPTRDGETLAAIVVRPRHLTGPQPAALFYGIYTDPRVERQAVVSAAHGYVGVVGFSRGKHGGSGKPVPYEHEVDDTHDVIDWIAKQPWSDGRVAMYGGSYCGFTQWAATKRMPAALKAIAPYVAAIPGQGLPMENNVFLDVNYGWPFYVADGPLDDDRVYGDRARWGALPARWFESGRPFREIDRVDGTPNPLLQRWLAHPTYDAYWQAMVPFGDDFARIDIPVLTVTGYYDDGQISALRYFLEHTRRNPKADHTLLIGPYDHFGAQRRPAAVLRGYAIDPVAVIDTTAVTFAWLDHVLRGGPLPELLRGRVNYEVMGANVWRHAASIDSMHDAVLTFALDDHKLAPSAPAEPRFLAQTVDLADRRTSTNEYYPDPIVHDRLDDGGGVVFESEPLAEALSIDGMFSGEIRVSINKRDFDLGVELYERTPDGKVVSLAYYLGRASHASDLTTRRLLTPGAIQVIPFERTRMVSRQLAKGSRIVVVLNVNKNGFAQVNMGTGKDVSDESAADGREPLQVRWYAQSVVRIPVRHG